jgi:hypothetical protein
MRTSRWAALLTVGLTVLAVCGACSAPPAPTPILTPATATASPPASLLTQEAAVQIAVDLSGWSDEPSIHMGFSRLTTWAEVPTLGSTSDRAPASGDHPVWFVGLGVGASPSGGASLLVVIDAMDGHVIETQQAIS